jgi:hypothetical protein
MTRRRTTAEHRRAGYLTPALALAVLTAFLTAALVLNVAWRRAASRELAAAADAAALAGAAELACDERLLDKPLPADVLDRVSRRAEALASRHPIVGVPALPAAGQTRIGRTVVGPNGEAVLLDTNNAPTVVWLAVQRGRDGMLPWLLRAGGHSAGRLATAAEAAIDDHVAALAPRPGGTVPVWPLALRAKAPVGSKLAQGQNPIAVQGWADRIELKLGGDRFGYDHDAKRVVERSDGLPELVVQTLAPGGDPEDAGLTLVDLGQSFRPDRLAGAMADGLNADDLANLDGRVPVASLPTSSVAVDALPKLPVEVEHGMQPGDARALFLFDRLTPGGNGRFTTRLNRVVVARLMDLRPTGDGGWRATFQPAVLATGTALLADAGDDAAPQNRYLYKVRLTR